ncbi:phosphonopyruvate decarboxylase [Candidatus Pelagibacter sp. RS40]|uniref:phosphonopyruvate decarboxylase n=1 Tax=Candidatus Pelagibacter sp. RS40 TaxID=1977865 RepID=UPI000A16677C|nr:phosphonopyruvate decarboxylase [Candidatus Pelagibacter sp. RS40]ARJ49225.1 phosphonopyruvate decarboxylase [Candidatus Pelagibacter sp. RS40]
MIKVSALINLLKKNKSNFYTGVPDSVLKELSFSLQKTSKKNHIIATNEGAAVSIGIGHYLSTKKIPVIYMQNSGLSNALNPLISIAHRKVYSIPLILIVGWRGSSRVKDEPQHNVKGKITEKILKLLNIKYTILRSVSDISKFDKQIKLAKKNKSIVACLIEQGTLEKNKNSIKKKDFYNLNKEFFLKNLLENLKKNTRIISSTGYNSRELMYLRKKYEYKNSKDFYMVGGMGHTSSVALGYSLSTKNKTICVDGDGSLLMHLGSIKTAGTFANKNFKYILLNNNVHDSVGGQSTYANDVDFKKLSKSFGFKKFYSIYNKKNLKKIIKKFLSENDLSFLEVKVTNSKIKNLPRPTDLIKIKNEFIR